LARVKVSTAREELSEMLNRVSYTGERVVLHRRGKDVAALVSMEDYDLLKRIEDLIDNEAADAALKEPGRSIPWKKIKSELGL